MLDGGRAPESPGPRDRLRAVALVARALGRRVPGGRATASQHIEWPGNVRGRFTVAGGGPHPAVLLVAGVTPEGTRDPRVVRLADAIARAGRVVLVPELELAAGHIGVDDVEHLVAATVALDRHPAVRDGVAMLGFSFGGSFSLVAAADERIAERVRLVAAFGAYGHLVGLIESVVIGATTVGGVAIPWPAHARARAAVHEVLGQLLDGLAEQGRPAGDLHAGVERLLGAGDADEVAAALAGLPSPVRRLIEDLSPVTVADRVRAPVALLHAVDDPTIPRAELVRLSEAFPDASVREVSVFTHVDLRPTPVRLRAVVHDLVRLTGFAATVLAAGRTGVRGA